MAEFRPIDTAHGSATSRSDKTQTAPRLYPAEEDGGKDGAIALFENESEEAKLGCRVAVAPDGAAKRWWRMPRPVRYLIVDGHSIIFAWPELRKLHQRRTSLARDALAKHLRDYQDWTGVRVVLVFDGKGSDVSEDGDPHDIQVMYSRTGQTADAIVERLAGKYAADFDVTVATSDSLERQTVTSFGATSVSPDMLRQMLEEAVPSIKPRVSRANKTGIVRRR